MLVLFAILIFVYNFSAALFVFTGFELSPAVELLYTAGFVWAAVAWLRSDDRSSTMQSLYCHGVLMNLGWFVIIPYHLLKTRGARGLLPLGLLVGSFVFAPIAAVIVYLVVFGLPRRY